MITKNDFTIRECTGRLTGKIGVYRWIIAGYNGDFANYRTVLIRAFDDPKSARKFLQRHIAGINRKYATA